MFIRLSAEVTKFATDHSHAEKYITASDNEHAEGQSSIRSANEAQEHVGLREVLTLLNVRAEQ